MVSTSSTHSINALHANSILVMLKRFNCTRETDFNTLNAVQSAPDRIQPNLYHCCVPVRQVKIIKYFNGVVNALPTIAAMLSLEIYHFQCFLFKLTLVMMSSDTF